MFFSIAWQNAAAERQSLTSIQLQAESFLANHPYQSPYPVSFKLSSLDPRLNLKPCNSDLQISFTRNDKTSGHTSLSIRCPQPVNWQLHLPVQVDLYDDVIVSRTALVKGQLLKPSDIKFTKLNVSKLNRGYFRQTDTLDKLQVKTNLPANSVLNPSNLSPRQLIKSGQQVTIVLKFKGLQVKSTGKALSSASEGELIKVRNGSSQKIVEGTVSATGQVIVSL